jgi:hypothetical protein
LVSTAALLVLSEGTPRYLVPPEDRMM